jgi:hypothetical protein
MVAIISLVLTSLEETLMGLFLEEVKLVVVIKLLKITKHNPIEQNYLEGLLMRISLE